MPRLLVFLFLSIFFLLQVSCNKKNNYSDKSIFRYNEPSGITSLDPAFAKDKANIWACNQIFNGLIQLNNQLKPEPCIAKNWELSDSNKKYTFILRDDVYFHEHPLFGENKTRKVVASDVVYSFNRIIDSDIASPGAWVFSNVKQSNGVYCFSSPNDTTFVIELNQPFAPFLSLLNMQYCSIVPQEIASHFGKDFRTHPIGTGPFYFKYWKENTKLVLLKNPAYFETQNGNRLPYLDAVNVTFIIDHQSAFLEFIKGNIDILSGIHESYKDELLTKQGKLQPKYRNKLNLYSEPYLNTEYLGFLLDSSLASTHNKNIVIPAIRKAINIGFDREKMIRFLRNNIGTAALNGVIPKGLNGFNVNKTYIDYNPDAAKQILEKIGYPEGKGLPTINLTTTKEYLDLGTFIQHQLSEIGIIIELDVMPSATLRENISQSKVQFFRASWIADYPDAENYLSLFYSKNFSPDGPNYTHFSNSEFDRIYELSKLTEDDSLRSIYYMELDSIVMAQNAIVPLYYDQVLRFTHKNIEGLESNPMNLLKLKYVRKIKQNFE